jgi:hypothetical protein
MPNSHARKPKLKSMPRPAPDPSTLIPRLRTRLDKERAGLGRSQSRLLRTFHLFEKQLRCVSRLERRLARLEGV